MSSPDSDSGSQQPNGQIDPVRPVTPTMGDNDLVVSSSQVSLPSTEGPNSPIEPSASFKTELNDDRMSSSGIIPSSLTPPPSSQVPTINGAGAILPDYLVPQRSSILSPPVTGLVSSRRDATVGGQYSPPSPAQVIESSADDLRSMLQASIAEHARLKMETAHHKLQYSLLCLQADEDAKRAAVEHDMVRREIDALRMAEHSRQARRELSAATESLQARYFQLTIWYEEAMAEIESLARRLKAAKKLITKNQEEIAGLTEDKELLLNRLRENREHFHILCSPGGIFHQALTPKTQTVSTPVQFRATPRQTPKSAAQQHRDGPRQERDHTEAPFAALLQVLSQENNSAPSTPTTGHRPAPRVSSKHTRNVQSMSSLPTTPTARPRGEYSLLPSIDLVPQSEPAHRYSSNTNNNSSSRNRPPAPGTPPVNSNRYHSHSFNSQNRRHQHQRTESASAAIGRKSRESTISAEDNEELARQALQSVAAATQSFVSRASHQSHRSGGSCPKDHPGGQEEEEEVFESQASQAASEMLRRDPRESFEVASSAGGSRDGTPAPAEKSARLQARLFPGMIMHNSSSGSSSEAGRAAGGGTSPEKRKFSGEAVADVARLEGGVGDGALSASPSKKLRMASGGLRDNRVGLGIHTNRRPELYDAPTRLG